MWALGVRSRGPPHSAVFLLRVRLRGFHRGRGAGGFGAGFPPSIRARSGGLGTGEKLQFLTRTASQPSRVRRVSSTRRPKLRESRGGRGPVPSSLIFAPTPTDPQPNLPRLGEASRAASLRSDPVQIPHDVEKRRATTQTNPELKQQVTAQLPAAPQVTDLVLVTLSRWRHVSKGPLSGRHVQQSRPARLLTDMSIKKAAQSSLTPLALYGRSSNAGPPRDTCRPGPNPKTSNRPLTCGFSRGAGRT